MSFDHPTYFYFLTVLVPMVWIFIRGERTRKEGIELFGRYDLMAVSLARRKRLLKFIFLNSSTIFLVIALAGPQWGANRPIERVEGADIVFAIDVSSSMDASDIKPTRLEAAKQIALELTGEFTNHRLGLVAFASQAVSVCPLTNDHDALKLLLDRLDSKIVSEPGTSFSAMLAKVIHNFKASENVAKILILLSDGEDHDEKTTDFAKGATKEGILVYSVGIGTKDGSKIPRYHNANLVGFQKDKDGNTVLSRLNDEPLKNLAERTGGRYFRMNPETLQALAQEVSGINRIKVMPARVNKRENQFQYPLAISILLLIAGALTVEKTSHIFGPSLVPLRIASRGFLISLLLIFSFSTTVKAASRPTKKNNYANRLYREGKYQEALSAYLDALNEYAPAGSKRPGYGIIKYNLGNALYKEKRFRDALKVYEQAISSPDNKRELTAAIYYNIGNIFFSLNEYSNAAENYKQSLRLNPNDTDAKFNLELALRNLNANQVQQRPPNESPGSNRGKERESKIPSVDTSSSRAPFPVMLAHFNVEITREDALRILDAFKDHDRNQPSRPNGVKNSKSNKDW